MYMIQPQKSPVEDRGGDTLMTDAVQDEAPPPQASHQEVWSLFESIWSNVCHVRCNPFLFIFNLMSSGVFGV